MNYEKLLDEAQEENLIVKEFSLRANKGRIKGNRVAIRKNMPTIEKACVLAEELGHHYTTQGDILEQNTVDATKQEQRARLWAYDKMIGLQGIINAYKHGCSSLHEMADYLDITEEFLREALQRYRSKYGCFVAADNYIIYFEPSLCVLELFT